MRQAVRKKLHRRLKVIWAAHDDLQCSMHMYVKESHPCPSSKQSALIAAASCAIRASDLSQSHYGTTDLETKVIRKGSKEGKKEGSRLQK